MDEKNSDSSNIESKKKKKNISLLEKPSTEENDQVKDNAKENQNINQKIIIIQKKYLN